MIDEQTIAYNKKLIKKYPFLQPRNVWSDKIDEDYDYSYTLADNVPEGWLLAFGEEMWYELLHILEQADFVEQFRFVQIKEKWGELCLYSEGVPAEIEAEYNDWEEKYRIRSAETCIICGNTATTQTKGWIMPVCDKCFCKVNQYRPEVPVKATEGTVPCGIADCSMSDLSGDQLTVAGKPAEIRLALEFNYDFSAECYKFIPVHNASYIYRTEKIYDYDGFSEEMAIRQRLGDTAYHEKMKAALREEALEQAAYETVVAEADTIIY